MSSSPTIGQMNIVLSANTATYSEAIASAQRQLDKLSGKTKEVGHTTVSSVQAASASIRLLEGGMTNNIRAVERFISTIPGVGTALKAAFPIVGALAFAGLMVSIGERVADFIKKMQEVPNKIRDGFREMESSAEITTDKLRLSNDELQNQINKLQGKPQNNLAIEVDNVRIAADNASAALANTAKKVRELLEQNKVSALQELIGGGQSTNSVSGSVLAYREQMADLAYQMKTAARSGDRDGAKSFQRQLDEKGKSYDRWLAQQEARYNSMLERTKKVSGEDSTPYRLTQGFVTPNLNIIRGERIDRMNEADQATEEARTAPLKAKISSLKDDGQDEVMKALEADLASEKLIHSMSIKEIYDFWTEARKKFAAGSAQYDQVVEKQAQLAVAGAAKTHEAIAKYLTQSKAASTGADDLAESQSIARHADQMRRDAQRSGAASGQGFVDTNLLAIADAHNDARERESELTDKAGRSMSQYAAAIQMAVIHAKEFTAEMEALEAIRNTRALQSGLDPSKENNHALAESQAAIAQAQSRRSIQSQNDNDQIYGRQTSAVVGATDALDDFIKASKDSATQLRDFTASTLSIVNGEIIRGMSGQRTNFGAAGADIFRNLAGLGLNKAEGSILGIFGLGGRKKPSGASGDPLHVVMDASGASGASSSLTSLLSHTSGSSFAGIASAALSVFPKFASGGGIGANTMAIVGERGPELFMPGSSGQIVPNDRLGGLGGQQHVWNIDARGATDPAQVHAQIMAAAPYIAAAAVRQTSEQRMRKPSSAR